MEENLSTPEDPEPSDLDVSNRTDPPISRLKSTRFAVGFLALGLLWAVALSIIASVLLPQRLKDIGVTSPEALLGTINAINAVVSLATNLIFGNLSDRSRSKWGRRAPWIVSGALLSGSMYALIGVLNSPVWIAVAFALSMAGLNMLLAPSIAVLSDGVPLVLRGTMSSFFGVGVTAGYPLGTLIGSQFITNPPPGFLIAGVLGVLAGVLTVAVWPREPSAVNIPPLDDGGLIDLLRSFSPPRNAPDFYKAFFGRLFMLVSYQMIFAYQLYILQNYLGQSTEQSGKTIGVMSIIMLVVSLLGSAISGPLSDKIGRRKIPVVIASLLFAVGIAMPWIFPTTMGMYLFAGIAGLGYAVYTAVDQALNVDVLPDKEHAGKDLGILNLGTTLGQMGGPLLTSAIVVATGSYQMIFPISIIFAILGATVIWWIRSVK